MTQKLEMLKGVLQKVLGEEQYVDDYHCAFHDCIYCCDLKSEEALKVYTSGWINMSEEEFADLPNYEKEYKRGVQFVADEWDKILSEGSEGEK